jgi:hypothetical protein
VFGGDEFSIPLPIIACMLPIVISGIVYLRAMYYAGGRKYDVGTIMKLGMFDSADINNWKVFISPETKVPEASSNEKTGDIDIVVFEEVEVPETHLTYTIFDPSKRNNNKRKNSTPSSTLMTNNSTTNSITSLSRSSIYHQFGKPIHHKSVHHKHHVKTVKVIPLKDTNN